MNEKAKNAEYNKVRDAICSARKALYALGEMTMHDYAHAEQNEYNLDPERYEAMMNADYMRVRTALDKLAGLELELYDLYMW